MFRSGTYTYDRSDENEIGLRCGVWVSPVWNLNPPNTVPHRPLPLFPLLSSPHPILKISSQDQSCQPCTLVQQHFMKEKQNFPIPFSLISKSSSPSSPLSPKASSQASPSVSSPGVDVTPSSTYTARFATGWGRDGVEKGCREGQTIDKGVRVIYVVI